MNELLNVQNISKTYNTLLGEVNALENISFKLMEGDFIAIVGASGCGKSTLLNILDGIDSDYEGSITSNNNKIGYMLQQDTLLPWLTIKDNAMIGLKIKNITDDNWINTLLKKYGLYNFINRKPNNLSGGMRQRVSLIRTLTLKPDILLLDEPFSALDYQTKLLVENDIYNIIKKEKKSAIMVTHDIEEAVAMANKVIVLTSRPARIKKIYDINLENNVNPLINRKDPKFNYYVNKIWNDLDINE